MFHVKHSVEQRNDARAYRPNAVPLWMWGVKEKDMGGFRHFI